MKTKPVSVSAESRELFRQGVGQSRLLRMSILPSLVPRLLRASYIPPGGAFLLERVCSSKEVTHALGYRIDTVHCSASVICTTDLAIPRGRSIRYLKHHRRSLRTPFCSERPATPEDVTSRRGYDRSCSSPGSTPYSHGVCGISRQERPRQAFHPELLKQLRGGLCGTRSGLHGRPSRQLGDR
jgi:hypothetical protein